MGNRVNNVLMGLSAITGFGLIMGLAIVLGWAWQGFVLSKLWGWFIAPTFGLPSLQYAIAVGIIVIWRFLNAKQSDATKKESGWSQWGWIFLYPAVFLLLGWVVTFFI